MGMFSEMAAESTAKQLEKFLLDAMNEEKSVQEFAKNHLYKWYLAECGEGFVVANNEIVKFYND